MPSQYLKQFLLAAIMLLSHLGAHAEQQPPIPFRISSIAAHPYSTPDGAGVVDRMLRELFSRFELHLDMVHLPPERALLDLNAGILDGITFQAASIEERYQNFVRVPFPFLQMEYVAFTKRRDVVVHQWEDLKDYNVAYIAGWELPEQMITKARSVTRVKNVDQLFDLLKLNRTDLIIYSRMMGQSYIKQNLLSGIESLFPVLASEPMYLYLHKRHQELSTQLAHVLNIIEDEGLREEWEQRLIAPHRALGRFLH
jgi:polar amino acid transport system substrate-binding protein